MRLYRTGLSFFGASSDILCFMAKHALKFFLTLGVFYVLLTHSMTVDGERVTVWQALSERMAHLEWQRVWPYLLLAALLKTVGIGCAIYRWHLLLTGQKIRFSVGHLARSFLIGRFLGTFLPGTLGLDGYKLYDAARFSDRVAEPIAATAVEKMLGLCGILLTFLVSAPFGYAIFGTAAGAILTWALPLAAGAIAASGWLLFQPRRLQSALRILSRRGPARWRRSISRLADAVGVYEGRGRLLIAVYALSFGVHFTTASLYFYTALAVGAVGAHFGEVVFASSMQIIATVLSPFTLAGEGVRELVQALLLAKRIGTGESILSAALGFWAAEALTLVGAYFWWRRDANYRPHVSLG